MPSPATIAGTRNAAAMCASGTRISASNASSAIDMPMRDTVTPSSSTATPPRWSPP